MNIAPPRSSAVPLKSEAESFVAIVIFRLSWFGVWPINQRTAVPIDSWRTRALLPSREQDLRDDEWTLCDIRRNGVVRDGRAVLLVREHQQRRSLPAARRKEP